jgi:hypothetical protein
LIIHQPEFANLFRLTGLKIRWWRVETVNGTLFWVINDLDAIFGILKTLGKSMGVSVPQVAVDEYYRLLLATEKLQENIDFLRGIAGRTKV